jgi:hypothetical protein
LPFGLKLRLLAPSLSFSMGDERLGKKLRLLEKFPKLSHKACEDILNMLGFEPEKNANTGTDLENALDVNTPYGPLLITIDLPIGHDRFYKWHCANPFAFLFVLCQRRPEFCTFLRSCCDSTGWFSLVYYTDEETPGNQNRPDHSRVTQVHSWTLREFPGWFRSRVESWLTLGYMHTKTEQQILGGLSSVLRCALTKFFSPDHFNFASGCRLPDQSGGHFLFRASFAFFVQDYNAFTHSLDFKGSGGLKPCGKCMNMLQTDPEKITDPYFKHIAFGKPCDFHLHTKDSFWGQIDIVAAASEAEPMSDAKQKEFEKFMGVSHNPHSLASCKYLRKYIDPVLAVFFDWMHCLVGSGSLGQYAVNAFILAVLALRKFTLKDLDQFSGCVIWQSGRKLSPTFFSSRTAGTQGISNTTPKVLGESNWEKAFRVVPRRAFAPGSLSPPLAR